MQAIKSYEHGYETSDFKKSGEFLIQLGDYSFSKRNPFHGQRKKSVLRNDIVSC